MLWKSKYPNQAKELFPTLNQMTVRSPLDTNRTRILLWLIIAISTAFILFSIEIPTSTGTAPAPEWSFSSNGLRFAGTIDQSRLDELEDLTVYLPLVVRNYPATPFPPELNPISNADGNGSYTVSWTAVESADTYLLQEDDNADFSSPTTVYEGAATSLAISGKALGTYYYRVMAYNAYASSGWSNVESVVVNATLPDCPQTGSWRGHTNQGQIIEFVVESTPACQIAAGSLSISYSTIECGSATAYFSSAIPIFEDNLFWLVNDSYQIIGSFDTSDQAHGTWKVDYYSGIENDHCLGSGTWQAWPVVGANGPVTVLLVQPDEKILVGGGFTEVGRETHHNLARLNPDGSLDTAFTPDFNGAVLMLAIQTDNKILVGGNFTQVDGQYHLGIARLNSDGSLDTNFNAKIVGGFRVLGLQSDGKILVGGYNLEVNEQQTGSLARLNSDGTLDTDFHTDITARIEALAVQTDDKILVGSFANYSSLIRLNADGSRDYIFSTVDWYYGVFDIALQEDGNILAAYATIHLIGELMRYDKDGTRDTSFVSPVPLSSYFTEIALNTSGEMFVGGYFWNLNDTGISYLARLAPNGDLIPTFNPAPNASVSALAVQPDNKILVGGSFTMINGQVLTSIARLNPDGSLDLTFSLLP